MNLSTKLDAKSENVCYLKIERAITKWGAIEKSPYWKNCHL